MPRKKGASNSIKEKTRVRITRPSGRNFEIRYREPETGKNVRITVGSRDEEAAKRKKAEVEAMLLLRIDPKRSQEKSAGPDMAWCDFRELFTVNHVNLQRAGTAIHTESRLDIAERIARPKTLREMGDPATLQTVQARLLAGAESRRGKPRSSYTVRGYMNTILAALNWAYLQGWLPERPRLRKIKTSRQKAMKGRPVTEAEFQKMLDAVGPVVGKDAAPSWLYVLRALWASGLRLDELMHVAWDDPAAIRPVWEDGLLPVLNIPADLQKNDTEDSIPLLPWFEEVLLETPPERRTGWAFEPVSLQARLGRRTRHGRPNADWVGKVISRIGKRAGIVVAPADERTGRPVKFASAHDLRRSCAQRLRQANVPPLVISRVMRHESWETTRKYYAPGEIQEDARTLRQHLS